MTGLMNSIRLDRIDEINFIISEDKVSEQEKENLLKEKERLLEVNEISNKLDLI